MNLFMLCIIAHFSLLRADRPIASIAFHAQGEVLAVASGHKVRRIVPLYMQFLFGFLCNCPDFRAVCQLYIWHYNRRGETSSPAIILKTRRSLRAVHFHPYAAPFLLTAEVKFGLVKLIMYLSLLSY